MDLGPVNDAVDTIEVIGNLPRQLGGQSQIRELELDSRDLLI